MIYGTSVAVSGNHVTEKLENNFAKPMYCLDFGGHECTCCNHKHNET